MPRPPRCTRICFRTSDFDFKIEEVYGPTREYWTEFVFEAYVNHQTEAIFLAGLPDVPESRPHSGVNRQ